MKPKRRLVPAGEFKARCLALLDEVATTGEVLIVTKRGRAVAKVSPAADEAPPSLRGRVVHEDDIVSPTGECWAAER